ncbi:uridine synthase [Sesbania bispinosa]|nr:uridine synthase [Sesbania bispinosa]
MAEEDDSFGKARESHAYDANAAMSRVQRNNVTGAAMSRGITKLRLAAARGLIRDFWCVGEGSSGKEVHNLLCVTMPEGGVVVVVGWGLQCAE